MPPFDTLPKLLLPKLLLLPIGLIPYGCIEDPPGEPSGEVVAAFSLSNDMLIVEFSEEVDPQTAEDAQSYATAEGLEILSATLEGPTRVGLMTATMDGEALQSDVLLAPGVLTTGGVPLAVQQSPSFIHGLASISGLQAGREGDFPFGSPFEGSYASVSCAYPCGPPAAIQALGFFFLQTTDGGPNSAVKIDVGSLPNGYEDAFDQLAPGFGVHVRWAGGILENVDAELRLTDGGLMESAMIDPNPLPAPPPYPIDTIDVTGQAAMSESARALQGITVELDNVNVLDVGDPGPTPFRTFTISDESGGELGGRVFEPVADQLASAQNLTSLRGILHQPSEGVYELLVLAEEFVTE